MDLNKELYTVKFTNFEVGKLMIEKLYTNGLPMPNLILYCTPL